MITNVTMNSMRPSFGMARLQESARETAQNDFGFERNQFINGNMFKKPGAIGQAIHESSDFCGICHVFGESKNGKANAEFIKKQILSRQGEKAISRAVEDRDYEAAIVSLVQHNYDNPNLSKKDTVALLEKARSLFADAEYRKYQGLLVDAE